MPNTYEAERMTYMLILAIRVEKPTLPLNQWVLCLIIHLFLKSEIISVSIAAIASEYPDAMELPEGA